jgi:hypothetical protein
MIDVDGSGDSVAMPSATTTASITEADGDNTDWEDLEDWTEDTNSEEDTDWEDDGDWEDEDKLERSETGKVIGGRKRREKSGKRGKVLLLSWRQPTTCNCSNVEGRRPSWQKFTGIEAELSNDLPEIVEVKPDEELGESTQSCQTLKTEVQNTLVQDSGISGSPVHVVLEKDPTMPDSLLQHALEEDPGMPINPMQSSSLEEVPQMANSQIQRAPEEDQRMPNNPVQSILEEVPEMANSQSQRASEEDPRMPHHSLQSAAKRDTGMPNGSVQSVPGEDFEMSNSPVQSVLGLLAKQRAVAEEHGKPKIPLRNVLEKDPGILPMNPELYVSGENSEMPKCLVQNVFEGIPGALDGSTQCFPEKQAPTALTPSQRGEEMLGARRKVPSVTPLMSSSHGGLIRGG